MLWTYMNFSSRKIEKLMERLEKANKIKFTDLVQKTSSPLCPHLQPKCWLDGKQKVPKFFLSSTYYKRPDIILKIVNTEV